MTTAAFQTGRTYFGRFIGDSDARLTLTVASRTAKTIKTSAGKTLRIAKHGGAEYVKPLGSYSMAPVISAERVAA